MHRAIFFPNIGNMTNNNHITLHIIIIERLKKPFDQLLPLIPI